MLLNSWATLDASADATEPLSLQELLAQLFGFTIGRQHAAASHEGVSAVRSAEVHSEGAQPPPLAIGIGCAGAPSSLKGSIDEKLMEFAAPNAAACYWIAL